MSDKFDDKNSKEKIDYSRREFLEAYLVFLAASPFLFSPRIAFARPTYNFTFFRATGQLYVTQAFASVITGTAVSANELRTTQAFASVITGTAASASEFRTTQMFASVVTGSAALAEQLRTTQSFASVVTGTAVAASQLRTTQMFVQIITKA